MYGLGWELALTQDRQAQLDLAASAVRRASRVCRQIHQRMVTPQTLEKKDRSPVTAADFASQAVVCAVLADGDAQTPVVAEEDASALAKPENQSLQQVIAENVCSVMGANHSDQQIIDWISRGGAPGQAVNEACWTLDPIDGTKGYLRGGQYAIALARIERGRVVLAALGCPMLDFADQRGVLLLAQRGQGTRVAPLWEPGPALQIYVDQVQDPAGARFCESVESSHSNQSQSARIAEQLGISAEPVRMDSQAKYAAVARGDASIYLRMPTRADYREKIWDHAAGMLMVEEAGGCVTDVDGKALDFSQGRELSANRGVVATNGTLHDRVLQSVGQNLAAT